MVENNDNKTEEFKRETTILTSALEDIRTKLKNMGEELEKITQQIDIMDGLNDTKPASDL